MTSMTAPAVTSQTQIQTCFILSWCWRLPSRGCWPSERRTHEPFPDTAHAVDVHLSIACSAVFLLSSFSRGGLLLPRTGTEVSL